MLHLLREGNDGDMSMLAAQRVNASSRGNDLNQLMSSINNFSSLTLLADLVIPYIHCCPQVTHHVVSWTQSALPARCRAMDWPEISIIDLKS
jgi:hypothetical protein